MIGARDVAKISLNLVVVYVVGGALLAAVYVNTTPIIRENAVREKKAALHKIMPEADRIEKRGDWTIHEKPAEYFVAKKDSLVCGYLVESYGKGYSGLIHLLVAVDTLGIVKRISILSHSETPGLGDGIEEGWFTGQFAGKTSAHMKVFKSPTADNIQAISGATISSRAVTEDAVKKALEQIANAHKGN
jgi:electron transport complex protein RnfG